MAIIERLFYNASCACELSAVLYTVMDDPVAEVPEAFIWYLYEGTRGAGPEDVVVKLFLD